MNLDLPDTDLKVPKGLKNLRDQYMSSIVMERGRMSKKIEYGTRSLSRGNSNTKRLVPISYFSLESLLLLICLTASLLILPLILPPLPPPPFLLLLLPIGILAVLMILAFMPSNGSDITYTYA